MAGFFVVLGDIKDKETGRIIKKAKDVFVEICQTGVYSTNLKLSSDTKDGLWARTKESIFADYFSMRAGDYLFFFFDRKIYGVGRLVNVKNDCKYWGFIGANKPVVYSEDEIRDTRLVETLSPENRCVCFFEPVEYYRYAVDMDEALTAYPNSFRSIRVIQDRSFIKIDDEEALALLSLIIRRNETATREDVADLADSIVFSNEKHLHAKELVSNSNKYDFTSSSLLMNYNVWDSTGISHEMAVEAALVDYLTNNVSDAFDAFDYVSHQVSASPAKPVDYMEWIDVFGYRVSDKSSKMGIPIQFAIEKYYVIEIKRDELTLGSTKNSHLTKKGIKAVSNQLMKYVDWIAKNYAYGTYSMVKGIIVAKEFDEDFIDYCSEHCVRNYNDGYRDALPSTWNSFELVKYIFDGETIKFSKVYPIPN